MTQELFVLTRHQKFWNDWYCSLSLLRPPTTQPKKDDDKAGHIERAHDRDETMELLGRVEGLLDALYWSTAKKDPE